MEKQRAARQAALVKQLECGCPDSTCADGKSCSHPMRRISAAKSTTANDKQRHSESNNNHVSSTTPNVLIGSRVRFKYPSFSRSKSHLQISVQLYSRWVDGRGRDQLTEITNPAAMHQQNANNNSVQDSGRTSTVQLQLIPSSTPPTALTLSSSVAATTATLSNNSRLMVHNNAISVIGAAAAVHQQQQQQHQHQQQMQLSSNNNCVATATGAHLVNHNGNNRSGNTANSNSIAGHANDTNNSNICVGNQMIAITSNGDGVCTKTNSMNLTNIDGHQQQQQQHSGSNAIATNQNQQQHQQQQQIDININRSLADTLHNNHHNVLSQRSPSVSAATNRMVSNAPIVTSAPPLVLSLSQVSL